MRKISPAVREKAESIARDALKCGLEYGAEEGVETALALGGRRGLLTAVESTAVNGAEEAAGDILDWEFHTKSSFRHKKAVLFLVRLSIIAAVLFWIGHQLSAAGTEFLKYDWSLHGLWIALSAAAYWAAYAPAAWFWYHLLRRMGEKPTFFHALRAYYFSQLGKYIPGKVMVVIIRSGMMAAEQVRISIAAVCVFYETLTMMAAGLFLSGLIFLRQFHLDSVKTAAFGLLFLICVIPILPPITLKILKLCRIKSSNVDFFKNIRYRAWRNLAAGFGLMNLVWILFGISLYAAIRGVGLLAGGFLLNLPRFIAVAALSILIGFAVPVPIAPFGSQETILSVLLIPFFESILLDAPAAESSLSPARLALLISLAREIVAIASELAMAGIFLILSGFRKAVSRHKAP